MAQNLHDLPLSETAARFANVQTAMLADALDELGELRCTLPPDIRPVARGMRFAGPAFTITGRRSEEPLDRTETLRGALRVLGEVPADHVCVFEANDDGGFSGHIGEFHAACMAARGVVGSLTDGGSRDSKELSEMGYPVFSRYTTPQDGLPRWEIVATARDVKLGDVAIRPGDYVVADDDGVVVIPIGLLDEVLMLAERSAADESGFREQVANGVSPFDAFFGNSESR